jgi:acyl carrier protein phosphodiesterase
MNFLAHLYLSSPDVEALVGSLLPDLVRRPRPMDLLARVAQACRLHRLVDAFTDTHPSFLTSRQRLSERHGLFSGILVDVFYDHYLARDWARYNTRPLGLFAQHVYESFEANRAIIPTAMLLPVERMIEQNWLEAYATREGIRLTLSRMSRRFSDRFSRAVDLASAADDMVSLDDDLARDFHGFFPQLITYAASAEPAVSRCMTDV